MHRSKVGPAQVQPDLINMWKGSRVQSGMSMEDLKHQTALRLANEQRDDAKEDTNEAFAPHPVHRPSSHPYASPPITSPHRPHYVRNPPSQQYRPRHDYDRERNYTDSQLGIPQQQQQQQVHPASHGTARGYLTPRHRQNAPLADRGSAENREGEMGKISPRMDVALTGTTTGASALKGSSSMGSCNSLKSQEKNCKKKGLNSSANGRKEKDGRVTPVRDLEPNRIIYCTPNTRRELSTSTPNSAFSEPQRGKTNNRSPRPNVMHSANRSPNHNKGRAVSSSSPSCNYFKNAQQHQQQSKLPHGLTVQELKEMTRARLAAEANYEGDSVHSGGTGDGGVPSIQQQDRNSPDSYPLPPPLPNSYGMPYRKSSADGLSISSGSNNGTNNLNYVPHHPSMPPPPTRMHPNVAVPSALPYPYPRHASPVYKTHTDTWEEYPSQGARVSSGNPSFSSPSLNRERCFSAGATTTTSAPRPTVPYETSSWEEQRVEQPYRPYYEETNRPRCATMSPPGMSRLHEDRPFFFSGEEKEKLAIPPLSEPRPRFHTTGILGSAFEPISTGLGGMQPHQQQQQQRGGGPPSPPDLAADRVKFNVDDRMLSTGSNGDLPSSVAEAVLESLTASTGPIDLFDVNHSPLRSSALHDGPFRKSSSAESHPLDRIVTESSGSESFFSSGPSQKSVFSSDYYTNERMLSTTNSWGGEVSVGDDNSTSFGFSQEFNNLLIGGPAMRSRAQTAPCFGENHLFKSQLDPEHNLEVESGNRLGSAPSMMLGFGASTNLPPGFDKPNRSG